MEFRITQELAQALLNYLAEQKYSQVFMLVAELQKLQPVKEEKETEKVDA